jgi:protein arginine N-methyltransferase 5
LPPTTFFAKFWGEKVYGIQICTSCFISNEKGFPVLSKPHFDVVKEFMKMRCKIILAPKYVGREDITKHY